MSINNMQQQQQQPLRDELKDEVVHIVPIEPDITTIVSSSSCASPHALPIRVASIHERAESLLFAGKDTKTTTTTTTTTTTSSSASWLCHQQHALIQMKKIRRRTSKIGHSLMVHEATQVYKRLNDFCEVQWKRRQQLDSMNMGMSPSTKRRKIAYSGDNSSNQEHGLLTERSDSIDELLVHVNIMCKYHCKLERVSILEQALRMKRLSLRLRELLHMQSRLIQELQEECMGSTRIS
jgi:hypothetical protein